MTKTPIYGAFDMTNGADSLLLLSTNLSDVVRKGYAFLQLNATAKDKQDIDDAFKHKRKAEHFVAANGKVIRITMER